MNHLDSALLTAKLEAAGNHSSSEEEAEYVFVNSCTVTHGADRDSKKEALKAGRKEKKVVFMGCSPKINLDKWKKQLPDALVFDSEEDILNHFNAKHEFDLPPRVEGTRYPLVIQEGCDNACTFCITYKARGRHKNKELSKIITEIKYAEEQGFQEVFLTGINLAAWGTANSNHFHESQIGYLLSEICKQTEIPRIRLSSLGPEYLNDEFWEAFKDKKICDYLHISMQSGSDGVLKRMNRKNIAKDIENIVKKARLIKPNVAICADIICGFPGETEAEFQETYDILKKLKFAKLHVFKFSRRAKTPGYSMPNQVDEDIKNIRAKKLRELADSMRKEFIASQLDRELEVLTEKNQTGLSTNYIKVKTPKQRYNKLITIKIVPEIISG